MTSMRKSCSDPLARRQSAWLILAFGVVIAGCGDPGAVAEHDSSTAQQDLNPAGFTPWGSLGVSFSTAVTSRFSNQRDLFFIDAQHRARWKQSGDLGWTNLDGNFANGAKPAATNWRSLSGDIEISNHLAVAGRGANNKISVAIFNSTPAGAGGWTSFQDIAGSSTFTMNPAITYHKHGNVRYLYVIARKSDQKYYWSRNAVGGGYNHANWTAWTVAPGGLFLSDPAAVSYEAGLWVVGRGLDNFFYEATYNGSTWDGWWQIPGGPFTSAPGLAAWTNTRLHVFGRKSDNFLHTITWDGGYGPIEQMKGTGLVPATGSPSADSWGDGHVDVVMTTGAGGNALLSTYQ